MCPERSSSPRPQCRRFRGSASLYEEEEEQLLRKTNENNSIDITEPETQREHGAAPAPHPAPGLPAGLRDTRYHT